MKLLFFILCIFITVNYSLSQSLGINDFEKCVNYSSPHDFSYLEKKGFIISIDSNENKFDIGTLVKESTNECVKIFYQEDSMGAILFKIDYQLYYETAYKKFISSLKSSQFKFNDQSKKYVFHTTSYSQQTLEVKEPLIINNKKYYRLYFTDYMGKELSMPSTK